MYSSTIILSLLVALLASNQAYSFTPLLSTHTAFKTQQTRYSSVPFSPSSGTTTSSASSTSLSAVPTPEESADALRKYMVKSLENSLKKDEELKKVKAELEIAKSTGLATIGNAVNSVPVPVSNQIIEDYEAKLSDYQSFIERYIVDSQARQAKAVKIAVEKAMMMLPGGGGSSGTMGSANTSSREPTLYELRNQRLAGIPADKSWWGPEELNATKGKGGAVAGGGGAAQAPARSSGNFGADLLKG